jgi:hypothetical protein
VTAIEELKVAWDREKSVWQQSLYDNILQLHDREAQWNAEREKQDRFLHKLQEQVVELQSVMTRMESRNLLTKECLGDYLQSLEFEVAILGQMVAPLSTTQTTEAPLVGHPMRRKTDLPYAFR